MSDRFGHLEQHGIDTVPDGERHGRPRDQFAVWAAANTVYLNIVVGAALVTLGLPPRTAIAVAIAGNLLWILPGLVALSGPAAGVPSSIIARAFYGVRGNRLNQFVTGWLTSIAYEAINLSVGALATFALLRTLGHPPDLAAQMATVAILAAITFTISVYGHATILRTSAAFALLLALLCAIVACYVLPQARLHAPALNPAHVPQAAGLIAATLSGFTLVASSPLSWGSGADYARYLPRTTSRPALIAAVTLGGFIPSVLLNILGILAATATDMTDPQSAFARLLPPWLDPLFLAVIIVGSITNNVLTAYSSGLMLQSIGVGLERTVTVAFDGIAGTALAAWTLFVSDFTTALNSFLTLTVALFAPAIAIYATDLLLRRNAYDAPALHDQTPASPFWGRAGFLPAGTAAFTMGMLAALLTVAAPIFTGPIAHALGGADLSTPAGLVVAAAVYASLGSRGRAPDG